MKTIKGIYNCAVLQILLAMQRISSTSLLTIIHHYMDLAI